MLLQKLEWRGIDSGHPHAQAERKKGTVGWFAIKKSDWHGDAQGVGIIDRIFKGFWKCFKLLYIIKVWGGRIRGLRWEYIWMFISRE